MILADLVSSISQALPRLIADSGWLLPDEEAIGGADIRYVFVRPDGSGERNGAGPEGDWECLRGARLGILGPGQNSDAVARIARERFGADIFHWRGADVPGHTLAEVLAAPVICVGLPWSCDLPAQVLEQKLAPVNAQRILVVWKRSGAIERALAHLGQHYVEPVCLSSLAAVACVSKFHLVRLFTATLGVTPHRYQVMLRLSGAKAMLRQGARITEAAHGVGFSDNSHLNRSFRSVLGMTPTQYQRSLVSQRAISF